MIDQYPGQRVFLVQAVRNATRDPDDSGGHLPTLAREIETGDAGHVETWLALEAIKLAQGL